MTPDQIGALVLFALAVGLFVGAGLGYYTALTDEARRKTNPTKGTNHEQR